MRAPAVTTAPAPPTLHPRYQGVWEQKPDLWPDDEPWEVDVDAHDFTERRWLTPTHRAALDAGTLDVPDRVNDHPSVLVSIPYVAAGTQVAWIDRPLAEVAYHAARLGAPSRESCENAGDGVGAYGWPDMPMLWFDNQSELDRFADLILGDGVSDNVLWFEPQGRFTRKRDRICAIAIDPRHLPRLAAYLRSL